MSGTRQKKRGRSWQSREEKDVEDGEGDEDAQIAPPVVEADAEWVVELISHCVRAGKGR
jgi:hypothetical protein